MPLAPGLYEHALTAALAAELGDVAAEIRELRAEQLAPFVARHLAAELQRALAALPAEERGAEGSALVERVLREIAATLATAGSEADLASQRLLPPPRQLFAVGAAPHPNRPASTLSASTLFTRSHLEPGLSSELCREIACADGVDVLIAFITVGGVRVLREALAELAARPSAKPRLRVLTTTFTGTTEAAALDTLARLPGAEVRVSFDTRRTRLHAKAWLFHRDNGLTTAYVGSANLTATALGAGHEWVVKVSAADLPHVVDRFAGTFETLWQDPEFERYDPDDPTHHARIEAARAAERGGAVPALTLFALRPYPFQEAILDRLRAERDELGHRRNLVVAATGTGKTVIAAFDYARQPRSPRLLFVAHRREILEQALATFRNVLADGAFGELACDGQEVVRGTHVFATIASVAGLVARFGAAHFEHVIIDECHHLPAPSYQAVLRALTPALLLGLTATPERSDGQSLLPDFDGRIAAELRLWHALAQQLLVPFEYYGLSDNTDLRHVKWTRSGYEAAALAGVYTGNDARARLVLSQLASRVADVRMVRGLGFCVSVEHAEYMAARATALGVPALAVHGGSPSDVRADAPRRLREREINLIFTCDLYNEGVDLPFVDVLLLLRPTSSATLFLQQLGRGLRLHRDKQTCLVLDFIGQHREEYRFEATLAGLTGLPRAKLRVAVEQGFPQLPSGCALSLDAVARDQILTSLQRTLGGGARRLGRELRELVGAGPVDLPGFLTATGRDLADVYTGDFGWRQVQVEAGVLSPDKDADEASRRLGWLAHVDEPTRLRAYRSLTTDPAPLSPLDARRLLMLDAQLSARGTLRAAEQTAAYFRDRRPIRGELDQLTRLLEDRVALAGDVYPEPDWPLALHRRYQRREIIAAVGHRGAGDKISIPQGGILKLEASRRELLFVTLDKSSGGFSPTTSYRDRAISRELFHWETQGVASVTSATSRRYLDSPANGWRFFLFVQASKDDAYAFIGPATYQSHAGDRPIGITWRLDHPLPAALFEEFALLAQG